MLNIHLGIAMEENNRTINLLQEYESMMGVRVNSNKTHFSIEEEIAYLHERIDEINRSLIHNRTRKPANTQRTTDASTQTEALEYQTNQLHENKEAVRHECSFNGNIPRSSIYKSTSKEQIMKCHFCDGTGQDLLKFSAWKWANDEILAPASFCHKMAQQQNTNKNSSQDNKRHISLAYIDTGQTNSANVSHIYLELSTSPLIVTKQNKSQEDSTFALLTDPSQTLQYCHPKHTQDSESDSKASYSDSEIDIPEYLHETSVSDSEADNNVTMRKANTMCRNSSFGTSTDFADGEDSITGSANQVSELSPFVTFVSNLDTVQKQHDENHMSRNIYRKRNLRSNFRNIQDRRPTPGPSGYLSDDKHFSDNHSESNNSTNVVHVKDEAIDLDMEDPELQAAAVKMQAAFKGFNARKKMGLNKQSKSEAVEKDIVKEPQRQTTRMGDEPIDIDMNDPKVEMAAIKMQAAFKGFSSRQKMGLAIDRKVIEPKMTSQNAPLATKGNIEDSELPDIDLNHLQLQVAATKMQAAFKGFNTRKQMGISTVTVPTFEEEIYMEVSEDGASVRLKCKLATTCKPPPIVTWLQNDIPMAIDSNPDRRIWSSQDKDGSCALTIYDINYEDSGVFSCRAKSSAGETVTRCELHNYEESITASENDEIDFSSEEDEKYLTQDDVDEMTNGALCLYFTFKPQSRVAERGMTAKFICGVQGFPAPEVKWFTAGLSLQNDGAKFRTYESMDDEVGCIAVLEISNADLPDAGEYICTASNESGQVYCSAELTVEDAEKCTQEQQTEEDCRESLSINNHKNFDSNDDISGQHWPLTVFGVEGSTTRFHSTFEGTSRPLLTWLKDGRIITSTDRVVQYDGDTSFGLEIANLRHTDVGLYRCVLGEHLEEEICQFQLVVKDCEVFQMSHKIDQPGMSSSSENYNKGGFDIDGEYNMGDSEYSQVPSSTIGCKEVRNSNSEQNSTPNTKSKVCNYDIQSSTRLSNNLPSKKNSSQESDDQKSCENETILKQTLHRSHSFQQIDNYPKNKLDSSRDKKSSRRQSSPTCISKSKSSIDQKEATSRRKRERRRGSNQSIDLEASSWVGACHRSSLDLNSNNGQKTITRRTRYSLPTKLDSIDGSFARISRLNDRLNVKVDNCLNLVDSVLELNAAVLDPEQEEMLQTKLIAISASLSDTSTDEEINSVEENGKVERKLEFAEYDVFLGDDNQNDDVGITNKSDIKTCNHVGTTCIDSTSRFYNLEIEHDLKACRKRSPITDNFDYQQVDNIPNNDTKWSTVNSTLSNDVSEHIEQGSIIISDESESDVVRPWLDTVTEETEDRETDADGNRQIFNNTGDTVIELSKRMGRMPLDTQNNVSTDEELNVLQTEIIKSQNSLTLQAPLPISILPNLSGEDVTVDKLSDCRTLSPTSPSSRRISIEEILALDSLPESTIDDKCGLPPESPSRKVNRDYNLKRNAQETLLEDVETTLTETAKNNSSNQYFLKGGSNLEKNSDKEIPDMDLYTKSNTSTIEENSKVQSQSPITEPIEPLRFTKHLKNIFVLDGDAVRLEVDISGRPTPTVKWFKAQKEVSQEQCELRHGKDNWYLVIRKVTHSDQGEYTCTASNEHSTVSSSCFLNITGLYGSTGEDEYSTSGKENTLDLNDRIQKHTSSTTPNMVVDGKAMKTELKRPSTLSLVDKNKSLVKEELIPSPTEIYPEEQEQIKDVFPIQKTLDNNANVTNVKSKEKLNLPIQMLNTDQEDVEDVLSMQQLKPKLTRINHLLTRESTATSVDPYSTPGSASDASDTEGAPHIIQRLHTLDVLEGQTAKFEIIAKGIPEPQVRWFKDGNELKDFGRIRVEQEQDTWKLIIDSVKLEDDGKYLCKVYNDIGLDTSSAIIYVEPLTENEHNLLTDEEESEKHALRWRDLSPERDFTIKDDDQEMHYRQLDGLSNGNMLLENQIENVAEDKEKVPSQKMHQQRVISEDYQNEKHLNTPTSIALRATDVGEVTAVKQIGPDEQRNKSTPDLTHGEDKTTSSPVHYIPARAKLLSQEQLLLGNDEKEKSQDDILDADASQPDIGLETYIASADYTPSPCKKENIPLVEGQEVEVLDSKSTSQWLIRTRDKKTKKIKQGWVPASHLTSMIHRSSTMPGSFRRQQSCTVNIAEFKDANINLTMKAGTLIKRGHCIAELLNGEKEFVKDLGYCIAHFIPPVEHPNVPAFLKGKRDIIFCNIKDIHEFHRDTFLQELQMCENDADSIGKAFIKWAPSFDTLYVKYCQNMNGTVMNEMTPAVKEFFAKYGGRKGPGEMNIQSYLIKPVQRISRYTLIIKDLIKYTVRANQDCKQLQIACNVMTEVPKKADNILTISQIEGFRCDMKQLGKLHRRDEFTVWHGKSKGRAKSRMVFLFDEILMFTKVKRTTEVTRHNPKDPGYGYVYKSHIVIPGIEVVKAKEPNDDRKFEVLNEKPNSVHRTLQGANTYVIEAWVKEILDLAEIAQLEGRKPIIKSRTRTLIRRGSFRGSIRSLASQRSISSSIKSITGSMSSFNSSETGSIGAQSFVSNRSSESGLSLYSLGFATPSESNNRASLISYVSNTDSDIVKFTPEVGGLYEIQHNVIAKGVEGLELSKGDIVKMLQVCDTDNTFHIQTIPTESFPYTKDGYIMREYLKKIKPKSEEVEKNCAPEFIERAKSRTVNAGETATFICQFTGSPNPDAEWNIPENQVLDERLEVTTTRGCSTLIIYQVRKMDEKEYTCTVSNQLGCISCSAKLTVKDRIEAAKPTSIDLNSTHTLDKSKLSLHHRSTPPLSLIRQNASADLSGSGTGDEGFKPMTVNNTKVNKSEMPLFIQQDRITTLPNLNDYKPVHLQARYETYTPATDSTMCNITEIFTPWCSSELKTKCKSCFQSYTLIPSLHYQNCAMNGSCPIDGLGQKKYLNKDDYSSIRLLKRTCFCDDRNGQCATMPADTHSICANEEDEEMVIRTLATLPNNFEETNFMQKACRLQANWLVFNDYSLHSISPCPRQSQAICV